MSRDRSTIERLGLLAGERNVLVLTADSVAERMAGPAIRSFEIAKALSKESNVRLGSTVRADLAHPDFEIVDLSVGGIRAAVDWADVVVFQGHILSSHPWIGDTTKLLVADIYDPLHLEQLEQGREMSFADRVGTSVSTVEVLNQQIVRADYMVCASEKQRDFWLGQLAAMGRINPATYDVDNSLRSLLDVVPFGVADEPPRQTRHAIKGVVDGIGPDDKVVIWGGGIYNWFDPLTLIEAVAALAARRPEVKLYFLGGRHPNPHVPAMRMAYEAKQRAESLGVLGRSVFFNEGWVPYEDRANYLLDADVGVSTHFDHLETTFSFRTRILDYLWTALPVVSTEGDTFAELIQQHHLGEVVPVEDAAALEAALERLLFDDQLRSQTQSRVREFAHSMRWERALEPLKRFCLTGRRAPDIERGMRFPSLVRIEGLQARVDGLESSTSWRITAPVRMVATAFRALLRGSRRPSA